MGKQHPHGLLLAENPGDNFLGTERVLTPDGRVDLAPAEILETFEGNAEGRYRDELANAGRMKLIGKREMKRLNSSSANSPKLVSEATNCAYLSREDAASIGVANGDLIVVESEFGRIEIPARVTDEMMQLFQEQHLMILNHQV